MHDSVLLCYNLSLFFILVVKGAMKFEDLIKQLLEEIEAKKPEMVAFFKIYKTHQEKYQIVLDICKQLKKATSPDVRLQLGCKLVLNHMPKFRAIDRFADDEIDLESESKRYFKYYRQARCEHIKQWLALEDVDQNAQLKIYSDDMSWTILKEICTGFKDLIPYALKKGCNPNLRSEGGFENTPLTWAIANDAKATAMALVDWCRKRGILLDINLASGFNQNTPLILAIAKGHERQGEISNDELTEYLLEQGADPNKADEHGFTPLHYAYLRRDLKAIELLTKHGARHDVKNHAGKTAWQMLFWKYQACKDKLFKITNGDSQGSCTFPKQDVFQSSQEVCRKFNPTKVERYVPASSKSPLKFVTPHSMFTPRFKLKKETLQKQQKQYTLEVMEDCQKKDRDQVLKDWNRASTIQIAGEQLKREDGSFYDANDLKDFFSERLVQPLVGLTDPQKEALLAVCQSSLHQGGLLYPASRVFTMQKMFNTGYHFQIKQMVNITPIPRENALYLHEVEQCQGWFMTAPEKKDYFKVETVLKLTIGKDLQPQIEVVDFVVTTHNSLSMPCIDERTLFEKLIDFLKSLFGMQAIHVNPDVLQRESNACQM